MRWTRPSGATATRLLAIADRFVGRDPGGGDDDTVEAFWAISCLDGPVVDGIDAMTAIESAVRAVAPRLGGFVVNFSLRVRGVAGPGRGDAAVDRGRGAAGALVVSSTRDPATPLVSAERLARTLGDASLVVVPGDRHTAFAGGNDCVDDAVTAYLLAPGDRSAPCHPVLNAPCPAAVLRPGGAPRGARRAIAGPSGRPSP